MIQKILLSLLISSSISITIVNTCYAQTKYQAVTKGPSPEQDLEIEAHNNSLHRSLRDNAPTLAPIDPNARPFTEYEENGYLIFSATTDFSSREVKREMAKNLSPKVKLVIYTNSTLSTEKERIIKSYKDVISPERILVVSVPGQGFWARDALPVPVVFNNSSNLRLVDAKYYHNFEPDQSLSQIFSAQLVSHDFYYEGGNFMPNRLGDCIAIQRNSLPSDAIFKSHYACKRIIRLPFVKGIGHVDESVKFLADRVVVTDTPQYVDTLKKAGYEVHMLPQPQAEYGTYVNALLLNGVLYLPTYGEASDQTAIDTYSSFGLKVVPVRSNDLSSKGKGSFHCITMNYPAVSIKTLIKSMGGELL